MAYCVHHVPGRARFKAPQIRADAALAEAVEQRLAEVEGVLRVEVNRRAASVIVHYDTAAQPLDLVVEHIRAVHPAPAARYAPALQAAGGPAQPAQPPLARSVGQVFGQAMFATLLQRTLERSLLSLLTGSLR